MLNRLIEVRDNQRAERANTESGFTLIELLVVVVIIGILIAIAIPLYLNYQKGAANKSAASDTRNAVSAVNQCISDANNALPALPTAATKDKIVLSCTPAGGTTAVTETINITTNNTMTLTGGGGSNDYTIATTAGSPGSATYTYDSTTGKTVTT